MAEKKLTKEKLSAFVTKATEKGKQAVADIQQAQQEQKEKKSVEKQEKLLNKLNPLFSDRYHSEDFKIPNIIKIVDDAVRRNETLCEGAIGWLENQSGVETLCLYDEYIEESGITFLPYAKCDAIYCVDPFDRKKFIDVDTAFERTSKEKIAELSNVANCLGAKKCSIEIVEETISTKILETVSALSAGLNVSTDNSKTNKISRGGKDVSYFDGSSEPRVPTLKWFANDDNIKGLIDMRCNGNNNIKSKVLEFKCASCATMSQSVAAAIDKMLPANLSASFKVTSKSSKEHNSKLIFEIEF